MLKVVCPKCGSLVVLNNNSKDNKCSVCGAQLFSYQKILPSIDDYYEYKEKELVALGFKYVKEARYTRLGQLTTVLLKMNPNNFWGHAFKIITELQFDLLTPEKLPQYKLNENDINIDMKARLYHAAREKYKKAGEKVLSGINNYYPDEHIDKKTSIKMKTNYDINASRIKELSNNTANISKNLKFLSSLAKTEEEKAFIENYKTYNNYLVFANVQLFEYDNKANNFIKEDYANTPKPGNVKRFFLYMLLVLLSLFTLSLSSVHVGLLIGGYTELMPTFDAIASIAVAAIILSMAIILTARVPRRAAKKHRFFITLNLVAVIAFCIVGIATVFSSTDTARIGDWFFIFGLAAGVLVFVYSVVKAIQYLPRDVSKNDTYIGDYKALSQNNISVIFTHKWEKFQGDKLSPIRIK